MAKKLKLILAALFVAFSSVGFFPLNNTFAEDKPYEKQPTHIQISPAKQKISLAPGSSYVGSMKVMNVGYLPFSYEVYATPYSVSGDQYSPNYTDEATYSHMSEWITFDQSTVKGTLQPDTSIDVAFTVNVPKDAPAGGQYAAIMAQTDNANGDEATIRTIHRVGMILYAAVPGTTNNCVEITKNTVNSFYFNPPITVSSLVKNCGNVEQTATYTVKMYPLFSNEAVFSNEDNPQQLDIYPDTSRFNSITWEGAPQIGIFKVTQTIDFGNENIENHEVTKYVLICPLWLLFVIIALIFFIIFWLVSRARDRKKEKRASASKSSVETKSDKEEQ